MCRKFFPHIDHATRCSLYRYGNSHIANSVTNRATHCNAGQRRGTIALRPKGLGRDRPVLENTLGKAVAAPTESGVLSRPDFLGASTFGCVSGFGRDGFVRKAGRTALPVFSTSRPPAALENVAGGFESRKGAKTMRPSLTASRSAAPAIQPTTGNTTTDAQAFALLEATSASALAGFYLRKGNIAAARRKAVQLLKALQVMEVAV